MPELPEVETVKLGLQDKLLGLILLDTEVLNPASVSGDLATLKGAKVVRIWRRAKVLGIDLISGQGGQRPTLMFHLKMTGQLILVQKSKPKQPRLSGGHPTKDMTGVMPNKSTRVVFHFATSTLYFNDQRKFGWVKVLTSDQVISDPFIKNLGPEPLTENFTWQELKRQLMKHKYQAVKVVLMDQRAVAGIGNIYASEALFLAKIDPRSKVQRLTDSEFKRLQMGIVQALQESIKQGGSTRAHFVNIEGHRGYFLEIANVYQRQDQPCRVCGTAILKITLGGRGTYLCSHCQT